MYFPKIIELMSWFPTIVVSCRCFSPLCLLLPEKRKSQVATFLLRACSKPGSVPRVGWCKYYHLSFTGLEVMNLFKKQTLVSGKKRFELNSVIKLWLLYDPEGSQLIKAWLGKEEKWEGYAPLISFCDLGLQVPLKRLCSWVQCCMQEGMVGQ